MKKILLPGIFVLLVSSCLNGDYLADLDAPGNTPVPHITCHIPVTDTTCVCLDSMSCYAGGELYVADRVVARHDDGQQGWIYIESSIGTNYNHGMAITLHDYTGPGTYDFAETFYTINNLIYTKGDSHYRTDNGTDTGYCTGGWVQILADDGNTIKGSFYGLAYGGDWEYLSVKGGSFIARWED